jgi:dephospho-CoA kinase
MTSIRLGLTGGIGSGKSTVARLLAGCGMPVVDADAISRNATATDGVAIPAIATSFGAEYITAEGALDRQRMRALVFQDATAKVRLEAIIHPLVGQVVEQQTRQHMDAKAPCIVFDIPLLVESKHWRKRLDRILVVDCSEATQMERVSRRDALPEPDILRIIRSQASRKNRIQAADLILYNEVVNLQQLAAQVRDIAAEFGL